MGNAWRPAQGPFAPPATAALPVPFAAQPAPGERRKLWHLGTGQHCAIVGTCLSIEDLRRIVVRAGLRIAADADDYSIHVHCVTACGTAGPLAKRMQKRLDQLYAGDLARARALAHPAALLGYWRENRAKGRIAGPFWALMTHPAFDPQAQGAIYGEVHMMSHLNGAARIADLARIQTLDAKLRAAHDRLAAAAEDHRAALAARDAEIENLRAECRRARAACVARPEAGRPAAPRAAKQAAAIEALRRKVASERARARAAEARLAAIEPAGAAPPAAAAGAGGAAINLARRKVLYVGGRTNQRTHLRAAIERHRGTFLHHDGGLEEKLAALDGLVSQADTVVCAIDCVSHGACLRVKAACRRLGRGFVPLRTASVACLQRALPALAAGASAA